MQDHSLYVPLYASYIKNVKEVEKRIDDLPSRGGIELNAPLISLPKAKPLKRSKSKQKQQKGHGKKIAKEGKNNTLEKESQEIETALMHPIQVL